MTGVQTCALPIYSLTVSGSELSEVERNAAAANPDDIELDLS